MTDVRSYRPAGIFDVRDDLRERRAADGVAATVTGPVRFAVRAVVTPLGRTEPEDWVLHTGRTISGLAVFRNRVVENKRTTRRLAAAVTGVELLVESPGFQPADVTFAPVGGARIQIDLAPGVDYPFGPATSLLRGGVVDDANQGVPGVLVSAPEALYGYRTAADGAWALVLPGPPDPPLPADVALTVTVPAGVEVLPGGGWTGNGPAVTRIVPGALPGRTTSVPELRLRLT
ncbi:hypothetical protein ACQP2E_12210 [Actinoplanes sp. CA-015351]|uniref:hypothetical protein n=1 Tax=Actinoplanes sp. CA-015351 TaxID=3239897 RepID=UPI003D9699ED